MPRSHPKSKTSESPAASALSTIIHQEQLIRFIDHLPVPIAIATTDDAPRLLYLNACFTKTYGYTLEEIPTEADWAQLAYPDEIYRKEAFTSWHECVRNALDRDGLVDGMEFRIVTKNGETRNILIHATIVGEFLQATLTDITITRSAEQKLERVSQEMERMAFEVTEKIPAGTYSMALGPGETLARFTFMSSRFLEICGLERAAAEADPLQAFECVYKPDRPEWIRKNAMAFKEKKPFSEETRLLVAGEIRWVHCESIPYEENDGSVVWQGVITDITLRKETEMALQASQAKQKEKEDEQRQLLEKQLHASLTASAIAHEINQPLSRIKLAAEMEMLRHKSIITSNDQDSCHLQQIVNDVNQLGAIIRNIKTLMRLVNSKLENSVLWTIVEDALLFKLPMIRKHGIHCITRPPDIECIAKVDIDQLRIAINNLIDNAIEAIASAPPHLHRNTSPAILISLAESDDEIHLIISDNGPGLAPGFDSKQMFRSQKGDGMGIGLFMVRTVLDNHGGRLECGASAIGGAEFRMIFPKSRVKPTR